MKKTLLLLLLPLLGISQSQTVNEYLSAKAKIDALYTPEKISERKQLHLKQMKDAINFQNLHRDFFEYKLLKFDEKLTEKAQQWADQLAIINKMQHSNEKGIGELIFYAPINWFRKDSNWMTNASVFWVLAEDDITRATLEQVLCKKCDKVGFGVSSNKESLFVVAKYNEKGDFKD